MDKNSSYINSHHPLRTSRSLYLPRFRFKCCQCWGALSLSFFLIIHFSHRHKVNSKADETASSQPAGCQQIQCPKLPCLLHYHHVTGINHQGSFKNLDLVDAAQQTSSCRFTGTPLQSFGNLPSCKVTNSGSNTCDSQDWFRSLPCFIHPKWLHIIRDVLSNCESHQ